MAKEYTSVGNEYGIPAELSEPTEHINPAPDIGANAQEHTVPQQYGESFKQKVIKDKANGLPKKLLRKMVYGVSSAVMVVTLATSAMPSAPQPDNDDYNWWRQFPLVDGWDNRTEENNVQGEVEDTINTPPAQEIEAIGTIYINAPDLNIEEYSYSAHIGQYSILSDGTIQGEYTNEERYGEWYKVALNGISFDIDTNTLTFDNYTAISSQDYPSWVRIVEITWLEHNETLNINFNGDNRFRRLEVIGNNVNLIGSGDIYLHDLRFSILGAADEKIFDANNHRILPNINMANSIDVISASYITAIETYGEYQEELIDDYRLWLTHRGQPVVDLSYISNNSEYTAYNEFYNYSVIKIDMNNENIHTVISRLNQ